jgi:hypothetical protein
VKSGKPIKSTQHPEKEKVSQSFCQGAEMTIEMRETIESFQTLRNIEKKVVPKYFGFPFLC